jgi:protein gp37
MFDQLKRYGRDPYKVHRTTSWKEPDRWNKEARRAGRIKKVLTCPLSDFFHEDADAWRTEAWNVMRRCFHLHFQILTKRPLRIAQSLPRDWVDGFSNVWLGVSIESDDYCWRADVLRQIPAKVRWISAEPLLGPLPDLDLAGIHWIVVGGESGPGYRDMDHAWARQIRDMARAHGAAFYFKQSAGPRAGKGDLLDGRRWREFPTPAPDDQATEHRQAGNELDPAGENAQQEEKAEAVQTEEDEKPEQPSAEPDQSEKLADGLACHAGAEGEPSVIWKEGPNQAAHTKECQFEGQTGCCLVTPCVLSHDLHPISTCCLADPMLRAAWWNEIENQLELMVDLGFVPDEPVPWYPDGHNQVCKILAETVPYPTEKEWQEHSVRTEARLRRDEERQRQEDEKNRAQREAAEIRKENARLQGEVQRGRQDIESLRAERLQQQQEIASLRSERDMAEQAALRWQLRADDAKRQAATAWTCAFAAQRQAANAWRAYLDLLTQTLSGGFARSSGTRSSGTRTATPSLHQDLAVLGLQWPCTLEELQAAYRKLAKKFHPDRNPGDKEAENKFKEVQTAYERVRNTLNQGAA